MEDFQLFLGDISALELLKNSNRSQAGIKINHKDKFGCIPRSLYRDTKHSKGFLHFLLLKGGSSNCCQYRQGPMKGRVN